MPKTDWCQAFIAAVGTVAIVTVPVTEGVADDKSENIALSIPTYTMPSQTIGSIAEDEEYDIDYDSVIEIPVWKRMVFKFGKPQVKKFLV
jgi:hypothetical protein